jgi:hypothetical protein
LQSHGGAATVLGQRNIELRSGRIMTNWKPAIACVALLVGACATGASEPPDAARVVAAGSADAAFGCGMRMLNEAGYVVAAADRGAGFIRAERDRTGLRQALLSGTRIYDVLTVTVYPREDGRPLMRVVPQGFEVQARGSATGGRVPGAGSPQSYRDAREVLDACAEPATRPAAPG